jgi:hypothetical protein
MAEYTYRNLSDANTYIRLLTIFPPQDRDVIRCRTTEYKVQQGVNLIYNRPNDRPESDYVALSYEWGQPGSEVGIEVDGQSFAVRRNLYDFLVMIMRVREEEIWSERFHIWIDAISINQDDLLEKSSQVQLMADILIKPGKSSSGWVTFPSSIPVPPSACSTE